MEMYPKIHTVATLPNYRLVVTFQNGIVKLYDCQPLLEEPTFTALRSESLFEEAEVDAGGYGVIWSDEIDLSESELWLNGVVVASLEEA
jgi:hypothetical protein